MDGLLFDPEKHQYINANAEILPSVTQICEVITQFIYGEVDPEIIKSAQERGTMVHELFQKLYTDKIIDCPEDLSGFLKAAAKFIIEHELLIVLSETSMQSSKGYAGTFDIYGKVDGKDTLIDLKTTSSIGKKHKSSYKAQLNMYRDMLEEHCYKVEQMYVVQLKKDGTYKMIPIPVDDELANACLVVYRELHPQKTKKEKKK